jgi:hypothetical protein
MKKKKKNNYYLYCPEAESESGIVIPITENEQLTSQISETSEKSVLSPYQEMTNQSSQTSEKNVLSHYQEMANESSQTSEKNVLSPYQKMTNESSQTSEKSVPNTPHQKGGLENQQLEEDTEEKSRISKWDEQFMELRNNKLSSEETPMQLQDNFVAAATTYSKMIIAERHIDPKYKKMKPLDVGGVAGT